MDVNERITAIVVYTSPAPDTLDVLKSCVGGHWAASDSQEES